MFKDKLYLVTSCNTSITLYIILVTLNYSYGITTTHYDKPPLDKSIPDFRKTITFPNLTVAERQKRLLPYINFYISQNLQPHSEDYYPPEYHYKVVNTRNLQIPGNKFGELFQETYRPSKTYQPPTTRFQAKTKFTPFLETNALKGTFIPMTQPQIQKIKVDYTPLNQRENVPNYSAIYDKLSKIKLQQGVADSPSYATPKTIIQYIQRKPQISYIPLQEYQEMHTSPKTYIHTYTPTSVDLLTPEDNFHTLEINNEDHIIHQTPVTPQSIRITHINNPKHHLITSNIKPTYVPLITFKPQPQYIVQEQKQYHTQNHKQYLQEVIPSSNPLFLLTQKEFSPLLVNNQIEEKKPYILFQPTQSYTTEISSIHQNPPPPLLESPTTNAPSPTHESPNSLSVILKKLQDSNALPQTLTADNIDNSIKTLINILNSYKKGQKLSSPIIVEDVNDGLNQSSDSEPDSPASVTQTFPANTPEGGTPGRPGIDYPALSHIPQTNFDCQTQRYKGFFADPDTNCQVWHYCDLNGGQASFLCPNGTIFSQVALTCDWWFNVKCSTTTQLYVLNERLYKYIIPLKPKFPEDYTGPLVDKYLALKFQEMEEKLKKEKKEKEKDKNEEIDELQLLEERNQDSASHTSGSIKSHK